MERLKDILPAGGRARRAGVNRHHEGKRRRLGRRERRGWSSMTSGACSAIPTWPRSSPSRGAPLVAMSNRETADAPDIMANIAASFERTLEIADKAGIRARPHRSRSRHRLRHDRGTEPDRDRSARGTEEIRPADPARRVAKALHRQGNPRRRPIARLGGSLAVAISGQCKAGAAILRVHDVAETVQALDDHGRGEENAVSGEHERHDISSPVCSFTPITA